MPVDPKEEIAQLVEELTIFYDAVQGRYLGDMIPDVSAPYRLGNIPLEFQPQEDTALLEISSFIFLFQENVPKILVKGGSAYVLHGGREETSDLDYILYFKDADETRLDHIPLGWHQPSMKTEDRRKLFEKELLGKRHLFSINSGPSDVPEGYALYQDGRLPVCLQTKEDLIKEWSHLHKGLFACRQIEYLMPPETFSMFHPEGDYDDYEDRIIHSHDWRFYRRTNELMAISNNKI